MAVAEGGFAMCQSGGTQQKFKRRDGGDDGKANFAMCHASGTRQSSRFAVCYATAHSKLTFKSDINIILPCAVVEAHDKVTQKILF